MILVTSNETMIYYVEVSTTHRFMPHEHENKMTELIL